MKRLLIGLVLLGIARGPVAAAAEAPAPGDTTRLAIVMGGAVSLGAFEAGILAELVKQLERHNHGPDQGTYIIDILVGASAGSMSLALLAREMFDHRGGDDWRGYAESSIFHQSWVDEIDIDYLLPESRPAITDDAFLFSNARIFDIAERHLGSTPPGRRGSDGARGRKLSIAPDTLTMVMTLSNMEGLERHVAFRGGERPIYFFHDQRAFELFDDGKRVGFAGTDASGATWEKLVATAIASGAFPLAFRPVALERNPAEFDPRPENAGDGAFHYVDGGFFNNDPINLAKTFARSRDPRPLVYDRDFEETDRKFIFLAPEVETVDGKGRKESSRGAGKDWSHADLPSYLARIVEMGAAMAAAMDYQRYLEDYERNERGIRGLVEAVWRYRDDPTGARALLRGVDVVTGAGVRKFDLDVLEWAIAVAPEQFVADSLETVRLAPDLDERFGRRIDADDPAWDDVPEARWLIDEAEPAYRQLFVDLFELRGYEMKNDFILISNDAEFNVAGSAFSRFGGFLSRPLREFDFKLGRYYAQKVLRRELGVGIVDPITRTDVVAWQNAYRKEHPRLQTLRDHFTSDAERRAFRDRIEARIAAYTVHLDIPEVYRLPLMAAANHWLDKQLYYYPRLMQVTGQVGIEEGKSLNAGFQLDLINTFTNYWKYDQLVRKSPVLFQLYGRTEYGYLHPRYKYWDNGLALEAALTGTGFFAFRAFVEFGRRRVLDDDDRAAVFKYYHGWGVKFMSFYISRKNERIGRLQKSRRGATQWRVGFSVNPASVYRTGRLLWSDWRR